MLVSIKTKKYQPLSKVEIIRSLKKNKHARVLSNDKKFIKCLMNDYKLYNTIELEKGVYYPKYERDGCLLNFEAFQLGFDSFYEIGDFPKLESGNSYGLCDSLDDIKEKYYDELENSDKKYFITLTPIFVEDQPQVGGFRFRKWGDYIGKKIPYHIFTNMEFLLEVNNYDEIDLEKILVYSIYEIKN